MLLVNNLGTGPDIPVQLKHAGWNESVHVADMAFPWFLFCSGIAIPFSAASWRRNGLSRRDVWMKIARRLVILILLGSLVDSCEDRHLVTFSIGILQTIALSYLVAVSLRRLSGIWRGIVAALLLVAYWAAIRFAPIPGMGEFRENNNLILYLNKTFLSDLGLWGLTRIVPTSALVLIGTCVGDFLMAGGYPKFRKVFVLVFSGTAVAALGYLWNIDLQFNKWVWTSSYVLLTAGLGMILLGGFFLAADTYDLKKWVQPLVIFGSNAILAYVLPIVVKSLVLTSLHIYMGGWRSVTVFVAVWWLVFLWLFHRRIFLKA
jgi:predicted acyltransferase